MTLFENQPKVQTIVDRYDRADNSRKRKKQLIRLMDLLEEHPVIFVGGAVLMSPYTYQELLELNVSKEGA